MATLALGAVVGCLGYACELARETLTDAWVAPLHLSPDNERVVDLRIRRTKERAERAQLVAEIAAMDEEVHGAELGLERLRHLSEAYSGALHWSTKAQWAEAHDLTEQVNRLESERNLLGDLLNEQQHSVERATANANAGLVQHLDLEREQATLRQIEVNRQACDLELTRVQGALRSAEARGASLSGAASPQGSMDRKGGSSPDVVRYYDDQVRIELELTRLEGERRAAMARKQAATTTLGEMDDMLHELESRPLYRAMSQDTDMAFAPYDQLSRVAKGDVVYACSMMVVNCRVAGTVADIVPGEVITQDPWGEMARGQYLVLAMTDRAALFQRILRVRHGGAAAPSPVPSAQEDTPTAAR
jgi:hypothetical protein